MHNKIISFGISYVKKAPLRRVRHLRHLKRHKNRSSTGEQNVYTQKEVLFLTWEYLHDGYFYAEIRFLFFITK